MPKTRATSQPTQVPTKINSIKLINKMLRRTVGLIDAKINKLEERITSTSTSTDDQLSTSTRGTAASMVDTDTRQPYISTLPQNPETTARQVIYAMPNVAERPRYPGKQGTHPVTFIEDLTAYLNKRSAVGNNIDIIIECLEGETRDWARIYKERWTGFEDFKKDFMSTYWGEAEQNELRRKIVHNSWDKTTHPTMLGHFISLAGQAKMLSYTIPEKQLIDDIIGHFPKHIQYSWAVNSSTTILDAAEFLRKMDNINNHELGERSTGLRRDSSTVRGNHQSTAALRGRIRRQWNTEWKKSPTTTTNNAKSTQAANVVQIDDEQPSAALN